MEASKSQDTDVSLLKEILKWTKFAGMQQLRKIFENALTDDGLKKAYQLSDGTIGLVEIGDQTGIKKDTLSKHWKYWGGDGLG